MANIQSNADLEDGLIIPLTNSNKQLENITTFVDENQQLRGVVIHFRKDVLRETALEEIVELSEEYFPKFFSELDYTTKYERPRRVWIKQKSDEKAVEGIRTYIIYGNYKKVVSSRHQDYKHNRRTNTIILGYINIHLPWNIAPDSYAVILNMRDPLTLIGNFTNDTDTVKKVVPKFCEYVKDKLKENYIAETQQSNKQ